MKVFVIFCILLGHVSISVSRVEHQRVDFDNKLKQMSREEQCGCNCMQGQPGVNGQPGVHGVPGERGLDGRDGRKGDQGEPGKLGPKGPPGLPGKDGPKGPSGRKGKRGVDGKSGVDGPKGQKGEMGPRGLLGPRGHKGEKGELPNHVAFSVARASKLGPVEQDMTVLFDRVFTNVGEMFDEYTSHFVCKLNGTYMFTTHILGQEDKDAIAWLMVNNKHQLPLHADGRSGYGTGSNTIILTLKLDDHVWLQLSKNSALLNDYSTFSGFLLFSSSVPKEVEDPMEHFYRW
ncbi:unnamed protein product [Owenia fusiformis]|uniref:Uncharacterized protein n=1 Tax=Owenia fusiformis TaxID=6347 RepID=A0A8J1U6Y8_OWEFU|nr:unnamed protein product [Owenia fusiformis]